MIEVTCIRTGTIDHCNRHAKGRFVRKFRTMHELAEWICSCKFRVVLIPHESNLTRSQYQSLSNKIQSYRRRRKESSE